MTEEERENVLAVEKLRAVIEEGLSKKCLLSQMELEVEEQKRALGQRAMDEKLASLKPEDGRPKSCPRCGKSSRRRAAAVERTPSHCSSTRRRSPRRCQAPAEGATPRATENGPRSSPTPLTKAWNYDESEARGALKRASLIVDARPLQLLQGGARSISATPGGREK